MPAPSGCRRRSRGSASGSSAPDQSKGGQSRDSAAPARHRPSSGREPQQSLVPDDPLAPPHQDRTNRTAAPGPDYADPSWPSPPQFTPIATESWFGSIHNCLLQQYRPRAEVRLDYRELLSSPSNHLAPAERG